MQVTLMEGRPSIVVYVRDVGAAKGELVRSWARAKAIKESQTLQTVTIRRKVHAFFIYRQVSKHYWLRIIMTIGCKRYQLLSTTFFAGRHNFSRNRYHYYCPQN